MNLRNVTLAGMILLALAFTINIVAAESSNNKGNVNADDTALVDDIPPYDGQIGPDHALYGLKIALENFREGFVFNKTERLEIQMEHARLRLAEAKAKLIEKNDKAVEKALEGYREKVNESENLISILDVNETGILHAQKMIMKHQFVLKQLLDAHPNNKGLARAYDNSLNLEKKFDEKILRKLRRMELPEESIQIKAKIIGNDTQFEIKVKFGSDSIENITIAQEIVDKLRLSRENISDLMKLETKEEGSLKEVLAARAEIEDNRSKIEVEYRFALNETNRSEIIDGAYDKLQALTADDVLKILEIKIDDEQKKSMSEDRKYIQNEKQDIKEERKESRYGIGNRNRD